jgi:uncharacterized membrane protein YoaK (UPF0700 family)
MSPSRTDIDRRARSGTFTIVSRTNLLILLTFVTGVTDATAFERLGNVFTSVMTGNMVLLGLAVGKGDLSPAFHVGLALMAYVSGAMLGGRIAGHPTKSDGPWPHHLTRALLMEFGLFGVFAIAWEVEGGHVTGGLQVVLLVVCAIALGIQSSAVLRLGLSGLSTTYLTGTLTNVVHAVAHGKCGRETARSTAVLLALISGAAVGGLLAVRVPTAAPIPQLVVLTTVIGCGIELERRHQSEADALDTDREPMSKPASLQEDPT